MRGRIDRTSGAFTLKAKQWLLHPDGYVTAGMSGTLDPARSSLGGHIDLESCGSFALSRPSEVPSRPSACDVDLLTAPDAH